MHSADLLQTPLEEVHRGLGAKIGPFAGWAMPIEYEGTVSEHRAVRERVGLFDLSHLGKVDVTGPGALPLLQQTMTNDHSKLRIGGALYNLILNDHGGVEEDLIAYRLAIEPCGLGARDVLRLEMGYPLYGQDLFPERTPLEAGLSWAVSFEKGPFRGRDALEKQKREGVSTRLRGLVTEGRRLIPRAHCAVLAGEAPIGEVTSGTFSPTLGHGIALAYLSPAERFEPGTEVQIDVRGKIGPARVVKPPFVDRSPRGR